MGTINRVLGSAATIAALGLAGVAFAAPPQAKATGGITMSGPSQAISFSAFDSVNSGLPAKGSVTYSNFDYPGGLTYTAPVLCANVDSAAKTATFVYQIPDGYPGLSGLYIAVRVYDGGTPGTNGDTFAFAVVSGTTGCGAGGSYTAYPITGGNLVVH